MNITRFDAAWNFFATLFRIGSTVIVLPLVLRYLSKEDYGMWTIFITYGSLLLIIDFGFANSFTRNITYIFSGVQELSKTGYVKASEEKSINYNLLKGVILAMRSYYRYAAFFYFVILSIATLHIHYLLKTQYLHQDATLIYIAWIGYVFLSAYQMYTFYYDALLMGRGLVKRHKQITIISQLIYILSIAICVVNHLGLLSMVIGLILSVPVNRYLCYKIFYNPSLIQNLQQAKADNKKEIIKLFSSNSIKLGLSSVAGYIILKGSVLISSQFLPLTVIASYGLTRQIIDVVMAIAGVWFVTYYPRMNYFRVNNDNEGVKRLYIKSMLFYYLMSFAGMAVLIGCGSWVLTLVKSNTMLLPLLPLLTLALSLFLINHHSFASNLLLVDNQVPFWKSSIVLSFVSLILLYIFLHYNLGLWGLILSIALPQLCYPNWKWVYEIQKIYRFTFKDIKKVVASIR